MSKLNFGDYTVTGVHLDVDGAERAGTRLSISITHRSTRSFVTYEPPPPHCT